eukprot:COSAG02_NODE_25629_length_653_cov_0.797834_1_plen_34_part_10
MHGQLPHNNISDSSDTASVGPVALRYWVRDDHRR